MCTLFPEIRTSEQTIIMHVMPPWMDRNLKPAVAKLSFLAIS
jgi:hypothetical protein